MTPRQIELVQKSFNSVKVNADQAADLFYERLFSVTPELRAMFPADMAEQKKKLMDMLQVAIDNLHRVDVIMPDIKEMGRRHKGYGVTVSQYALVGGALLWTLEQALGADFTPELKAAWTEIYTTLAGVMTSV